ncbi:MAG: hypothetical protein KGJ79_06200 [Alphaproteobacteria bacterium]|nr:hypothetical protein [Alphaproteobacteria bacterium]MDE2110714.1 hypothetical protein [Alphaproteobacteria bacterium]MDE2494519.1 hypothetical protein [Alphaproteobacteria bacterium]
MTDELDILLLRPLPPVADDGFSAHVMARANMHRRLRFAAQAAFVIAGLVLAFLLLPLQAVGLELNFIIGQVANSAAVSMAVAAIILTLVFESQFSRI